MSNSAPMDDSDLIIEAAPFEQVPNALWAEGPKAGACSPRAVVCYLALRNKGAERNYRITRKKLAAVQGVTVRTVDAALDELVEKGWLLITPTFRESGDRQQSANRYTLLWNPIREATDERLLRHQRAVQIFESDMDVRRKANLMKDEEEAARLGVDVAEYRRSRKGRQRPPVQETAGGATGQNGHTPSQFSAGAPSQFSAGAPSQFSAGEDPDSFTHTSSTQTKTLVSDGSAAADDCGSESGLLVDLPAGITTTAKVDLDALFAAFHALYPKKVAPDLGLKAFKAAVKRGTDPETIIEAARAIHDHPLCPSPKDARDLDETVRDRWTYMKLESTWLNQGDWAAPYPVTQKWEDDLAASTARRGGQGGFYSAPADDIAKTQDMFSTPASPSSNDPWADQGPVTSTTESTNAFAF